MIEIGFTGTRAGMTEAQKKAVATLIQEEKPDVVHHGDCVGADADFHALMRSLTLATIEGHPGPDDAQRAHCDFDVEHPVQAHFARNRTIVERTTTLIACPRTMQEEERGGTWYTIRYARKVEKRHIIVWPNGSVHIVAYLPPDAQF